MSDTPTFIHVGKGIKNSSKKGVAIPIKVVLVLLAIALIVFSTLSYGGWLLANSLTKTTVTVLLMVAIFSTPIMVFIGYWFGRTEVRGFLGGIDTALEKMAQAVDLRDGAKVNLHQKIQAPPPLSIQSPPQDNVPRLSFRNANDHQVIDL
ncbi:MAG: hypothetical protein U9Q82_11180 [Chloroflexota bacterium]|nr:hypothetical protein [Chloroflexota bacterium]